MMINRKKLYDFIMDTDNNFESIFSLIADVNSWNDSLDFLRYEINDEEFFNMYFESKPDEAVRSVCYGNYKYMDEYVKFNAYGNLVSTNEWELKKEYKKYIDEIIDAIISAYNEGGIDIDNEFLIDDEEEEE